MGVQFPSAREWALLPTCLTDRGNQFGSQTPQSQIGRRDKGVRPGRLLPEPTRGVGRPHWSIQGINYWELRHEILEFAAITYRTIRDRILAEDPKIDEQTLADTVEGLTDLHEIVGAIVRAALADEALATGLKGRIAEMQDRLDRLQECAAKRRQIAKDVMIELDIKKITAPDFTVSIRSGMPALLVLDEAAVPSIYWQPRDPRLDRQGLLNDLKEGADIKGVSLSNPEPVLSVRTR